MKRKFFAVLITSLLVLTFIPSAAFASTVTDKQTYVEDKTKQFTEDGLNIEDATYYAELDYMVKDLEKKGQVFEIDKEVPDMNDEEVISDVKAFRQKVLSGDKAAMKKAIKSTIRMYEDGQEKMEKLIKKNPNQSRYEVVYPDGSKVIYNPGTVEKQVTDDKVHPSGYQEAYMSTTNLASGNWAILNTGWQFLSGGSYAKIELVKTSHVVDISNQYHKITYALSGASYGGIVTAQVSTASIPQPENDNYLGKPAEAVAQANMSVSNSFAASFLSLSISVNSGTGWTQYLFTRGYGDGITGHYAAYYK